MDPIGAIIVAGVLVLAAAIGAWHKASSGRVRELTHDRPRSAIPGDPDPTRPLVVQFSSELCNPCRGVRRVISQVLSERSDATSVELDVAEHAQVAAAYNVARTPTVIVLDRERAPRYRVSGALAARDLGAALDAVTLTTSA